MTLDKLQEKLGNAFDLDKPDDCRKVLASVLRDHTSAQRRADAAETKAKMLAMLVGKDFGKAKEKAKEILAGKKVSRTMFDTLMGMSREMVSAENLSDKVLHDTVMQEVWSDMDMTGKPSALVDELMRRFARLTGVRET